MKAESLMRMRWMLPLRRYFKLKEDMMKAPVPDFLVVGCNAHREAVSNMMSEAVTEVNVPASGRPELGSSPLFLGCYPFRPTIASNPEDQGISFPRFMAARLGGDYLMTSIDPSGAEIDDAVYQPRDIPAWWLAHTTAI